MFSLKNALDRQEDLGQNSSSELTGKHSMWESVQFCPSDASGLTLTSAAVPTPQHWPAVSRCRCQEFRNLELSFIQQQLLCILVWFLSRSLLVSPLQPPQHTFLHSHKIQKYFPVL